MKCFMIHSPSRGTYCGFDNGHRDGVWKPTWGWAEKMSDPKYWHGFSQLLADQELVKVKKFQPNAYLKEHDFR